MNEVVVVIVTYNRLEMLKKCINSVLCQTYKINKVILIDNASTDGTSSWVKDVVLPECSIIQLIEMQTNTGGAGGFHHGLLSAMKLSCQYIWAMDDDVEPEPSCLENLIFISGGKSVVQPTRLHSDGSVFCWHHYFEPLSYTKYTTRIELGGDYLVVSNVACFEGILLPRRVVEDCGLPDKNYFICEDDTLYGYKVSRKYPILYTSKARMRRLGPISGGQASWKIYYLVRNKIWNIKLIRQDFSNRPLLIFFSYVCFPVGLIRDFLTCRFSVSSYRYFFKGLLHGFESIKDRQD